MTVQIIDRVSALVLVLLFALAGCIEQTPEQSGDVLIRIGQNIATDQDFNKALENAQSAYARGTLQEPAVYRQIRLGVLNQLVEEMIVREIAGIHDIQVSDAELNASIQSIKQDYPEGEFEKVLLERALSYASWKERLRIRQLAEKVAEEVLGEQIVITPEDIAEYYRRYQGENNDPAADTAGDSGEDEKVLNYLRKEKMAKAYTIWVNNLKKDIPIEINRDRWSAILGISAEGQSEGPATAEKGQP